MIRRPGAVPLLTLLLAGCAGHTAGGGPAPSASPNTLTSAEAKAGWRLLFDGKTTKGWRAYNAESMPSGWQVVDGALTRVDRAGDIITTDTFRDFELSVDWNISPGGHSGIFYRGARRLRALSRAPRRGEAARRVEHRANRRPGQPRRALAQRPEDRLVRAGERRLVAAGRGEQVQGVAPVRQGGGGLHRPAGPRRPGGVPEHQDRGAAVAPFFLQYLASPLQHASGAALARNRRARSAGIRPSVHASRRATNARPRSGP